jgi:hypothetical protein
MSNLPPAFHIADAHNRLDDHDREFTKVKTRAFNTRVWLYFTWIALLILAYVVAVK